MNFKALALGSIFAASTAMPASIAHPAPVVHFSPHTTVSALACVDEDFFEDGGFSRMIHNPHGTFYSGGTPGDEGGVGFAISGQNIITAQWLSTGTGGFDPFGAWYYTTNGSDVQAGNSFNPTVGRNGVLHWSFNRNLINLPSGARIVFVVFADFGGNEEPPFTDNATNITANGAASVPIPGVETGSDACFLLDD